ncbi:hypothetical protein MRGA423_04775 [Mycobacterium tuberculosis RGTB423]|nr:hypothetical protein MRGA423_04775 [Mycobacterium tuberculosis RGTB423]
MNHIFEFVARIAGHGYSPVSRMDSAWVGQAHTACLITPRASSGGSGSRISNLAALGHPEILGCLQLAHRVSLAQIPVGFDSIAHR